MKSKLKVTNLKIAKVYNMLKQDFYHATIPPVPESTRRPLWSVMIPTYNCASYLRESLGSVLEQDPGPDVMQIEVIDDCSTQDDPEAVVAELGHGRVRFYRQPQNVGYIRNFETCLQRSQGHLVHLLHGDDQVLPGFYRKLKDAFERAPESGAAFCRHIYMDEQSHWIGFSRLEQPESGILQNWLERVVVKHPIQTPSIVVRRSVYEHLGGFDRRFGCVGEDWEMWVRIAAHYPIGYEVEPLAAYRLARQGSLSKNSLRSGDYARDLLKANEIVQSYLPDCVAPSMANHLLAQAREACAFGILAIAGQLLEVKDVNAAIVQLGEAIRSCHSLKVWKRTAHLALQAAVSQIKQSMSVTEAL